ncbi:MAG TPA: Zn-dependent alcohol dehydrogenase [Tepidisphaeraceae bacterium]|jgi:S-(hydroxymethyl)glutathione dehydrogenase/alcohol dehydrogenase|nr:Zn-dependent alcohol dehydrogenase [Tepidisphaeraceae bacterium]
MKIRAAILTEPQAPFRVEEVELDPPREGEVLVKMSAVGVCHSDWHLVTGATKHPMPVVAGHEGAGIVEAIGPNVTDIKVGDHVILNWAPACGHCFYCRRDRANLCETYTGPIWNGTMLDGTMRLHWNGKPLYSYCGLAALAEKTVVPRESCVVIDPQVSLASASLVGCAVATGVGAAIYTAGIRPGESVLVFGVGGVGINAIQGARLCGANPIIAVDTTWPKIWVARHFGAQGVFMADDKIEDAVRDITQGRGVDHAIDATGLPQVQERAFNCIRPGGTLTLAGLAPMGTSTNFPSAVITRQERTIKGSYYGTVNPPRDFPMYIDLYKAGKLNLDDMITKRYQLEQVNDAYKAMIDGEVARGVITFA